MSRETVRDMLWVWGLILLMFVGFPALIVGFCLFMGTVG